MASAQEAIVMNDAEKAVVEKMVEVAKSIGTTEKDMAVDAKNMQQNSAVVAMTNSTFASINFSNSHNWFGQITGSYGDVKSALKCFEDILGLGAAWSKQMFPKQLGGTLLFVNVDS